MHGNTWDKDTALRVGTTHGDEGVIYWPDGTSPCKARCKLARITRRTDSGSFAVWINLQGQKPAADAPTNGLTNTPKAFNNIVNESAWHWHERLVFSLHPEKAVAALTDGVHRVEYTYGTATIEATTTSTSGKSMFNLFWTVMSPMGKQVTHTNYINAW